MKTIKIDLVKIGVVAFSFIAGSASAADRLSDLQLDGITAGLSLPVSPDGCIGCTLASSGASSSSNNNNADGVTTTTTSTTGNVVVLPAPPPPPSTGSNTGGTSGTGGTGTGGAGGTGGTGSTGSASSPSFGTPTPIIPSFLAGVIAGTTLRIVQ